jgi:hypothetical protein
MIAACLSHDSERGDWRARPAADVQARGVSLPAGPAVEAGPAPEPSSATARDDELAAVLPHDSVTIAVRTVSAQSPAAPQDGPAAVLPHDSVTAGVWLAREQ